MPPLVLPFGPLISLIGGWLQARKERLLRDAGGPTAKTPPKTFDFTDAKSLPLPENNAILLADTKIAEKDYEAAKHLLINAWQLLPKDQSSEFAYLRLREGFVKLYSTRGESKRARHIESLPIMLLEREVQWIVTHPDEQIGGSAISEEDGHNEPSA